MDIAKIANTVENVDLAKIDPNPDNPRGHFEKDSSFGRLVESVRAVGILVPLLLMKVKAGGSSRYQLVDGERRYWAARELALQKVPANVIQQQRTPAEIRKLMFHLHMTREQWGALAQCRALGEAYRSIADGIPFSDRKRWEDQISFELNMSKRTARDRVHFLSWPRNLKERVFEFNERQPKKDVYSYVVAIEANVVLPSFRAFPTLYNHGAPPESFANHVRSQLFDKTEYGLECGVIVSREQIRDVEPLFAGRLSGRSHQVALGIFKRLVDTSDYMYQDARAEIETKLPQVLQQKPPSPRRLIASILSLTRILDQYRPEYADDLWSTPKGPVGSIKEALSQLEAAIDSAKSRLQ